MRAHQKQSSVDVARREAVDSRKEQEDALRAQADAAIAKSGARLKAANFELR
jgi:hypothetical protein